MFRNLQPSIGGVLIQITWGWFAIVLALAAISIYSTFPSSAGTGDQLTWGFVIVVVILGVFASLGVHEWAHALAAGNAGSRLLVVSPAILGALPDTYYQAESPRQELRVALAGPLSNLCVGIILGSIWLLAGASVDGTALVTAVGLLAAMNLGLAALNFMPGYPFDGGRILRAFIWYLSDDLLAATKLVAFYGYFLVLAGLALGVLIVAADPEYAVWGSWIVVSFWMINRTVSNGLNQVYWSEHSKRLRVDDVFVGGGRRVNADMTIDAAIETLLEAYGHGPILVVSDGEAIGLVTLKSIRPVPRAIWTERTIGDVATPLDQYSRVSHSAQLRDLIELLPEGVDSIALIERNGRIIAAVDRALTVNQLREYLNAERLEKLRQRAPR